MPRTLAFTLLLLGILVSATHAATTQPSRGDPFGDALIPPELILRHAQDIGLEPQQQQSIESQLRDMQGKFPEMQQELQQQIKAMSERLHQDHPDQKEVLAQFDKVLDAERQIKRAQLALTLAVFQELNPQQQARARELRQSMGLEARAQQLPESLRAKMQQVQEAVVRSRQEGRDVAATQESMNEVRQLLHAGKPREAEAALDRLLQAMQPGADGKISDSKTPDSKTPDMKTGDQKTPDGMSRASAPIDWDRAKALYQRSEQGEKLTPDEQAYLDRAKAERRRGAGATTRPEGGRAAGIDRERARELFQKSQRGEALTPDEQAYLERAKAAMQRGGQRSDQRNGPMQGRPTITGQESTGLVPLTQLTGGQKYKGLDGGLYGGGRNQPPEGQLKAAMAASAKIVPLDAEGKPSPAGKVVLMSIGMSNTTGEFSRFKQIADADPQKSPDLLIVDGAQGGKDAAAWANTNGTNTNATWEEADHRLKAAGADPRQVQVVWIKQALAGAGKLGEFPEHAKVLQKDLQDILSIAKIRYPNLRLAYLSSRIYAGYAVTMLNPEPYAYEGAFSVRGVIEDQIRGEPGLNAGASTGEVKAPVVLWGPYLWADGVKGREGDDLVYRREDLSDDGTHPSGSGRQKVADLLLKFFKSDPTAAPWFVRGEKSSHSPASSQVKPDAPATPVASAVEAPWTRDDAAHLLRRAAFGGTPTEIDRLHALGRAAAVEYLIGGDVPPGTEPPFARNELPPLSIAADIDYRQRGVMSQFQLQKMKVWWLDRMVRSDRPLEEKMTLFWHGLFTSGFREVRDVQAMVTQDALFHREAIGNYKRLAHEVIHDPAMLRYLNNDENVKGQPNENLARELMELFTMGEGNGYTEKDIPEVARALTGMTVSRFGGAAAQFDPSRHDDGLKTIFGQTSDYLPDDVADLIFERPEPANYLARRLWQFFGAPEPTEQDLLPVARALQSNNWELAPALRAMFTSPSFYDDRCRFAVIKSPTELDAMTLHLLGESQPRVLWASVQGMRDLGQDLFQPPNVKGWPGGERWITSGTVSSRYSLMTVTANGRLGSGFYGGMFGGRGPNFRKVVSPAPTTQETASLDPQMRAMERRRAEFMAMQVADGEKIRAEMATLPALPPVDEMVSPAKLFPGVGGNPTGAQIVDAATARFLQRPLPAAKKSVLIESLGTQPLTIGKPESNERIRQMLGLLMSTPEYQVE